MGKVTLGVKTGRALCLSHLMYVDDVLVFSDGYPREVNKLQEILNIRNFAIGMEINFQKSPIPFNWGIGPDY